MSALLQQLLSLCVALGGNQVATCKVFMIECVTKKYDRQTEVSDSCTKEYLKERSR